MQGNEVIALERKKQKQKKASHFSTYNNNLLFWNISRDLLHNRDEQNHSRKQKPGVHHYHIPPHRKWHQPNDMACYLYYSNTNRWIYDDWSNSGAVFKTQGWFCGSVLESEYVPRLLRETPKLLPCSKLNYFLSSEAIFGLKTIRFTFEVFKAATCTYMDCKGTYSSTDSI